jgi:SAM-dependent methyltransferase
MVDESGGGIFTGERLLANDPLFAADFARHLAAYQFAQAQVCGKCVLDAGCGDGYGTDLLAQTAARALGVDRAAATIALAVRRYQRPNLSYRVCQLDRLTEVGEQFDVVCNFQVIEHLEDPQPFLVQTHSVLKPGGCLILTTPNRLQSFIENPYHVHEYTAEELASVLRAIFARVEVRGVRGNQRVTAYEHARVARAQRLLRLDPFGLRRLLPRRLVEWAYPRLARAVRRGVIATDRSVPDISAADFSITPDCDGALDLVAICYA